MKHLLLTGKPGVGKTTLIENLVKEIQSSHLKVKISGFLTKEVRSFGIRVGFDIITLDGKRGVLARTYTGNLNNKPRIGKYYVEVADLENIGIVALQRKADIIILDEIGKMELLSTKFKQMIQTLFTEESLVIATIAWSNTSEISQIKNRKDIILIEVTKKNRNELHLELMKHVKGFLPKLES